jgi:hypothetical protein
MSLSLMHPAHAPAHSAARLGPAPAAHPSDRSLEMTVRVTTSRQRHTDALTGHAYSMPVVRELPIPPVAAGGDRTW